MLPLKNEMKGCAGVDVAALSYKLEETQPCFLHKTCWWTARHQAQSVEQQRRHGRASVSESHVSGGPLGSPAGSGRMLPPPRCKTYLVQIKSQAMWSCFIAAGYDVYKREATHTSPSSIGCVLLYYCASPRRGVRRRCPHLRKSAPRLLLTGKLLPCVQLRLSLVAEAAFTTRLKFCMVLLYVLVRAYHSVRKCKESFISMFICEPSLYFRTEWYGRVFLLGRFLT